MSSSEMAATVVVAGVVVLLGVAAIGATWRIVLGPSILDRMVASEVLLVIIIMGLLAEMAYRRHTTTLPVVLVLSALSFTGSVAVARYVSGRPGSSG